MRGLIFFFLRLRMKLVGYKNPEINAEKLRRRGVRIGEKTWVYSTAFVDKTRGGDISIGSHCVLMGCTILAHDAAFNRLCSRDTRFAPVRIGDNCFIGWQAIVLPGVTIGNNCVIGAGAVVTRDIPSGSIVAGNPARVIGRVEDMRARIPKEIK